MSKTISTIINYSAVKKCECPYCDKAIMGGEQVYLVQTSNNQFRIHKKCATNSAPMKPSRMWATNKNKPSRNCKHPYTVAIYGAVLDKTYFLGNGFEMGENKCGNAWFTKSGNVNNYVSHIVSEVFEKTNYKVLIDGKQMQSYDDYRIAVMKILGTTSK